MRSISFAPTSFVLGLILSLIGASAPAAVHAAGESLVSTDASGVIETSIALDLQIDGSGDDELELNLYVPSGSFSFGDTTGVTFVGASTGSSIKMTGTRSALNAALETLVFESDDDVTVTAEAWLGVGSGDFVYNSVNQHVYQVVTATSTWAGAAALATSTEFNGLPGYLATITTQQEHDFVLTRIDQDGWIGASDAGVEGTWLWMTGPEAGMQFWQGAALGTTTNGMFANWASFEPNNDTGGNPDGEDCAEIRFTGGANGKWNDLNCDSERASYVVEFGAGDDVPEIVETSFEIEVTSLPADEAAMEKITEYANTNGGSSAPTVEDYGDAGIEGVTEDNLEAINALIANTDPGSITDPSTLQNLVTPVIAYEIIKEYEASGGSTDAPTVENYEDAGIEGVTEENLEAINQAIANGGSISDLSQIQNLVDEKVEEIAQAERSSRASSQSGGRAAPSVFNNNSNLNLAAIMEQIAVLKARIAELLGQTASAAEVRDLTVGHEGMDVTALQNILMTQGHAIAAGATGYFGSQTASALIEYQTANGIGPALGYFGALTRAQMKAVGLTGIWW